MLGKEPNQALDAVKQEASEHRIHVGAGEVDKANLREHRGEEGRHEHDEDAVHNAADDQATATAATALPKMPAVPPAKKFDMTPGITK